MKKDETVIYHSINGVAHITLNRPNQINAFNIDMRDSLFQTLELFRDDTESKVAIMSGAGDRGFCAGADLTEFGTAPSQIIARTVRWERDLWGLFMIIRKPLVAAVHGFVIGSGVEITCLCDIRIASDDAVFRMPEAALSLVPAAGGTQPLSRNIGLGESMNMLLANSPMNAPRALSVGLVHRLVSKKSLLDEGFAVAEVLAALDPRSIASAKQTIQTGLDMPIDQGIGLERRETAKLISSR